MKSKTTAALLAFFIGGFGAHKFYLGEKSSGIVRIILTCTIIGAFVSGVLALIDFIQLLTMDEDAFDRQYNQ